MQIDLRQMLMLMVLIGLVSGLGVSISVRPISDKPTQMSVAPNESMIATSSFNGRVIVYDLSGEKVDVRSRRVGKSAGLLNFGIGGDIHFFSDHQVVLVTESFGGRSTSVWNLQTGEVIPVQTGNGIAPNDMAVDSHYLIQVNSTTNAVLIRDLREKDAPVREVANLTINNTNNMGSFVANVQITDDGSKLLITEQDLTATTQMGQAYTLSLIDVATGQKTASASISLYWSESPQFSPSGNAIAYVDHNNKLILLNDKLEKVVNTRTSVHSAGGMQQRYFTFSRDGSQLAIYKAMHREILIFDVESMEHVHTLNVGSTLPFYRFNTGQQSVFDFSNDGEKLYVINGSTDAGVQIWDIESESIDRRVGQVYRFWPGVFFAVGFCLWAIAWGALARRKITRKLRIDKLDREKGEFDDDSIAPSKLAALQDKPIEAPIVKNTEEAVEIASTAVVPPVIALAPPIQIGFGSQHKPTVPGAIRAAWVMMFFAGLWTIFYASVSAFYIRLDGIFAGLEFHVFVWRLVVATFLLTVGVMAFSRGTGRYTTRLWLTSMLMISTMIGCDFVGFCLGTACLLCCTLGNTAEFVNPRQPRIGTIFKPKMAND